MRLAYSKSCVPNETGDGFDHGTSVAGILAAKDDSTGIVGMAPGARLYDLKVADFLGNGTTDMIIDCLYRAVDTRSNPDPYDDIYVMNLSIGREGGPQSCAGMPIFDALHDAFCSASYAGIRMIAAAGNGPPFSGFCSDPTDPVVGGDFVQCIPATWEIILTVTDFNDTTGEWGNVPSGTDCQEIADEYCALSSNYTTDGHPNSTHTIAAPGGPCVWSTDKNGGYNGCLDGTSFAAPIVTGGVVNCWMVTPDGCGGTPAGTIQKILTDAAFYAAINPPFGFRGAPRTPVTGKWFGHAFPGHLY